MNLVIVHYHLNRGGVTRVIENQLAALDTALDAARPWRVALLYGGRREGWNARLPDALRNIRLSLHVVEGLDYDEQHEPASNETPPEAPAGAGDSSKLQSGIASVLRRLGFAPRQTLIHAHNHNLARCTALPPALAKLAGEGYATLLQVHDFIEDYRPDHHARLDEAARRDPELAPSLYPQAPHVHYAALNGRDHDILLDVGIAEERLHLLPNPVPDMADLPSRTDACRRLAERFEVGPDHRLILYPVRGIRRKNLGEMLLYAALVPPRHVFALTLPPLNQAEVPIYEAWKELAAELRLPCLFEVGAPGGLTFAENLAAADLIVTTSLAEGFGMVFLESWLAGRPLFGRDLPEITRDFVDAGVQLDGLHAQFQVPLGWIGEDRFRDRLVEAYRRTLRTYGREVAEEDLNGQVDARTAGDTVDFGDLDEALQQEVIRRVCRSGDDRRRLMRCNAWIMGALAAVGGGPEANSTGLSSTIQENVQTIRARFSRDPSGQRLLALYGQVHDSPRDQRPCPLPAADRILDAFLDFGRFRPIRS